MSSALCLRIFSTDQIINWKWGIVHEVQDIERTTRINFRAFPRLLKLIISLTLVKCKLSWNGLGI